MEELRDPFTACARLAYRKPGDQFLRRRLNGPRFLMLPVKAHAMLQRLAAEVANATKPHRSVESAERLLLEAIGDAIFDEHGQLASENVLEARISQAFDDALGAIGRPPSRWTCAVPVHGLHPTHANLTFAGVTFKAAPGALGAQPSWRLALAHTAELVALELGESLVGVVEVDASDGRAACDLAFQRVGRIADGLTFAGYFDPGGFRGVVWLAPAAKRTGALVVAETSGGDTHHHRFGVPPSFHVELPFDILAGGQRGALQHLEDALEAGPGTPWRDRICNATRLCARSMRADNQEEQVFWAVAALEAAAFGNQKSPSSRELYFRSALLLSPGTVDNAVNVSASVTRLYGIRSQVAHGSVAETTASDVDLARLLAADAIVRVAVHDELRAMRKEKEVDAYFHRRSLASVEHG